MQPSLILYQRSSPLSRKQRLGTIRSLGKASVLSIDYVILVVFSCIIATFGLALNSAAIIIGAMLIAPLMTPILAGALALVRGDLKRGLAAFLTLLVGVLIAIALSTLLGFLVSLSAFNILEELPLEILNRAQPGLFDLLVALAGGAVAAYAFARPELSATLPGVAIATALMPPLCTVGLGLSQGREDLSGGALLLFVANLIAIIFASSLTFIIVGFRPAVRVSRRAVLSWVIVVEGILVLVMVVILMVLTYRVITEAQQNQVIRTALIQEFTDIGGVTLVDFERDLNGGNLQIVATIRALHNLTYGEAIQVQRDLATQLQRPVALKLLIVPVTSLDPLIPPTLTPTPTTTSTLSPSTSSPAAP